MLCESLINGEKVQYVLCTIEKPYQIGKTSQLVQNSCNGAKYLANYMGKFAVNRIKVLFLIRVYLQPYNEFPGVSQYK